MKTDKKVNEEFENLLKQFNVENIPKRAEVAFKHILKYGYVTTEILKNKYNYDHPPRAIRDLKDCGILIDSQMIYGSSKYARYTLTTIKKIRAQGRRVPFPKNFKQKISTLCICAICNVKLTDRYLQIDHRIPFIILGDQIDRDPKNFMLLCASCNRAKGWSCQNCENYKSKIQSTCRKCYWSCPKKYEHVAMMNMRRADIMWQDKETRNYDNILKNADKHKMHVSEYIKKMLLDRK